MANRKAFTIQTKYNLWEEIVKENQEFQQKYESNQDVRHEKAIEVIPYDPAIVTPVMYGKSCEVIHQATEADEIFARFNPAKIHPAFAGYREITAKKVQDIPQPSIELPDPITCKFL